MGNDRREFGDPAGPSVFGIALREHRHRRGLSQEDLADATRGRVAVRTISDLERGVARRPRAATLRLLAEGLGLAGPQLTEFQAAARAARPPAAATAAVTRAEAVARGQLSSQLTSRPPATGRPPATDGAEAAYRAQLASRAGSASRAGTAAETNGAPWPEAARWAQAGGQAGFTGMLAPVIIVAGSAHLAGMEPLLSGAADCLIVVAGGRVLPAGARLTALEEAAPSGGPALPGGVALPGATVLPGATAPPGTAAEPGAAPPQPSARTLRRAPRARSRRRP
jgi:transcriptional regulator with XRE-family HTH domain